MKKYRVIFIALILFYSILGIGTAVYFQPRIKMSKAYEDLNPIWDQALNHLQIGFLEKTDSKNSIENTTPVITAEESSDVAAPEAVQEVADASEVLEESAPDTANARKYYTFTTLNMQQTLMIRDLPGFEGKVIAKLRPGSEGYVLEEGENWCYVIKDGIIGYSSHEYLKLTEIAKEDFPQEYLNASSPLDLNAPNDERLKKR